MPNRKDITNALMESLDFRNTPVAWRLCVAFKKFNARQQFDTLEALCKQATLTSNLVQGTQTWWGWQARSRLWKDQKRGYLGSIDLPPLFPIEHDKQSFKHRHDEELYSNKSKIIKKTLVLYRMEDLRLSQVTFSAARESIRLSSVAASQES